MMWKYNETEVTELSVMNMNWNHSDAWVGTFVNNEFTTRDLGTNFSQLIEQPAADRNYTTLSGGRSDGSVDPWDFVEYRIDWTKDYINFYIGGNLTRQVLHKDKKSMPSVPSAMYFKHWSTGNRYSMKGPPENFESVAEVGWIRMFFNSSSMSTDAREDFVARCSLSEACSMDDIELRGSTPYADVATKKWKQNPDKDIKRMPALWISVICITISTFLLIHALIRRFGPKVNKDTSKPTSAPLSVSSTATDHSQDKNPFEAPEYIVGSSGKTSARNSTNSSPASSHKRDSDDDLAIERIEPSQATSTAGGLTFNNGPSRKNSFFESRGPTPKNSTMFDSRGPTPNSSTIFDSRCPTPKNSTFNIRRQEEFPPPLPGHDSQNGAPENKIHMETVTETALPAPRMRPQPPAPRQRIDHLAGLTAMCSLVVTVMHFGLTFVPAMVSPGAPAHHPSETWAQRIIGPFLLNQMWLGVFFTTSTRFLTAPYLKRGNMSDIAKAAVRRTPRLMIPVASMALLEYFFIDIGATRFLQYIPSLTWSTWPYVTRYNNFLQYLSEILELAFLVPNAIPQITLHYCTGVLWTIAVQLQGTWLVLLGVVVVREIKSPWKRSVYYAFCIVNHWYAQSWGSYLWLGLLLTDLDVTYKWKTYLSSRPLAYYPVLSFFWLCVGAAFAVNVVPNWAETSFNFATEERGIHADVSTGEAISNTDSAGYPPYYTPRLNGILFAAGMQAIVELSPSVQWVLSSPPFLILFPHVFTIYLLHGLVFWTYGSWLLCFLADRGFSFSVNVTVVGTTSYGVMFAALPIVTPIIEALGKDVTSLVWMTAQSKSPPRRRTLFPFPEDLFTTRGVNAKVGEKGKPDVEAGRGEMSVGGEAGKEGKGAQAVVHEMRAFSLDDEKKVKNGTRFEVQG
jgi:hypothetical protein